MPQDVSCPRAQVERIEAEHLSDKATLSTDERCCRREYVLAPDDVRTAFHRDYTRIIHSRAFRRLRHKTQVFISPKNDHVCTRMEHSLHVASIASTIAQVLRLNVELVRAIAMGHDLGHAPFGHKGERSLDQTCRAYGLRFSHELHSLRVVDRLESPYADYPGLNLTFAVRDGIACHYGEGFEQTLSPDRDKPFEALETMEPGKALPATLEGCVVRWADKVAYMGRDLEDALTLGIVSRQDVPERASRVLGTTNREIISRLVRELLRHGMEDDRLSVGDEVHEALNCFYRFSYERIYQSDRTTDSYEQVDRAMRVVFGSLLEHLEKSDGELDRLRSNKESCLGIFAEFLRDDIRDWRDRKPAEVVRDFIAGMTDSFFIDTCAALFLPKHTV